MQRALLYNRALLKRFRVEYYKILKKIIRFLGNFLKKYLQRALLNNFEILE